MSKVVVELSMSLDGFVAGPNDGPATRLAMVSRGCSTSPMPAVGLGPQPQD